MNKLESIVGIILTMLCCVLIVDFIILMLLGVFGVLPW